MPPLVLVTLAWLVGLIAAHYWLVPAGVEPMWLLVLGVVSAAAIFLWRTDRSMRLAGFAALALLAGVFRYQSTLPDFDSPAFVAHYNERGWAAIEGVLRSSPEARDTWAILELDAERIEVDGEWRPVQGKVLVRTARYPGYEYGDRLRVAGLLEAPPILVEFSYRDYLAKQGIHSTVSRPRIELVARDQESPIRAAIYAGRNRARDAIARLMPDPEASLLQGILLGIDSGIPPDLYDDYNATGTSHVIVISGANLIIVSGVFSFTFGRLLGRRRAFWFVVGGLAVYVMFVGSDPAVVRAAVMAVLLMTARFLGRMSTAYVSLVAAAALLTIFDPFMLWDVGFQLSFAASLALILFAGPLQRYGRELLDTAFPWQSVRSVGSYAVDVLAVTLAALLLTVPLVVYTFGRLSLVAPLANLLIAPVQPLIMGIGGVATALGLVPILQPMAQLVAWAAWLCLAYTNAIVRWMAAWPQASIQVGPVHPLFPIALYGLVLAAVVWSRHRAGRPAPGMPTARRSSSRSSTKVLLGAGLVAAILAWLAVLQLPDGNLHVVFLDVGQGDAILITTPGGEQILVDGGPSPRTIGSTLGDQMPFWDRTIELIAMTHPDADHTAGLVEVLQRFKVKGWIDSGQAVDTALNRQWRELVQEAEIPGRVIHAGERLDLGHGVGLEVLHPPAGVAISAESDTNDASVVLRLVWKRARFLFTGDLEAGGEEIVLASGKTLKADVLKIAHHGSGTASTKAFLTAVSPSYAVISVGGDNRFGHPDPDVLTRIAQLGNVQILRTDLDGTVEFTTDGLRMWTRTED